MKPLISLLLVVGSLPVMGQAWDVRVEAPFGHGQALPSTRLDTRGWFHGDRLDDSRGLIISASHRMVRVNPVLRLDWTIEYAQLKARGTGFTRGATHPLRLEQQGFGAGVNAQFWLPFTGFAGEIGLIQRFHTYELEAGQASHTEHLSRTWVRVGARWRLALPSAAPYVAVSYQQPLSKGSPRHSREAPALASFVRSQGSGQEFERLWTVGIGVQF